MKAFARSLSLAVLGGVLFAAAPVRADIPMPYRADRQTAKSMKSMIAASLNRQYNPTKAFTTRSIRLGDLWSHGGLRPTDQGRTITADFRATKRMVQLAHSRKQIGPFQGIASFLEGGFAGGLVLQQVNAWKYVRPEPAQPPAPAPIPGPIGGQPHNPPQPPAHR
ncbi:MAG: hypothetical protein IT371_19685 [Deltaproteobacteria bacterium]|nr:hypothetical protein [Deltaproteobacteria bacterium]